VAGDTGVKLGREGKINKQAKVLAGEGFPEQALGHLTDALMRPPKVQSLTTSGARNYLRQTQHCDLIGSNTK
jgi:hypothetical protein